MALSLILKTEIVGEREQLTRIAPVIYVEVLSAVETTAVCKASQRFYIYNLSPDSVKKRAKDQEKEFAHEWRKEIRICTKNKAPPGGGA